MSAPRGFVLINALVMVAALSALALALLSRAEGGRARVMAAGQAVQLELYLDAYETLARALLNADPPAVDHDREAWARTDRALELDRGRVTGRIADMQGRFNLNLLANPEDAAAREIFDRLAAQLGLAPRVGDEIAAALARRGPGPAPAAGEVPEDPPGGAVLMLDQLPLPEKARARLLEHVTVLPGSGPVNVNTATAPVLASLLPGASAVALSELTLARRTEPFVSREDFQERLVAAVGAEAAATLDEGRISVSSTWFEVEIAAELEGRIATRRAVLRRMPLPAGAEVAYRLDRW